MKETKKRRFPDKSKEQEEKGNRRTILALEDGRPTDAESEGISQCQSHLSAAGARGHTPAGGGGGSPGKDANCKHQTAVLELLSKRRRCGVDCVFKPPNTRELGQVGPHSDSAIEFALQGAATGSGASAERGGGGKVVVAWGGQIFS